MRIMSEPLTSNVKIYELFIQRYNHVAEQRIKTFNFFIIILIATFGGALQLFIDDRVESWVLMVFGILSTVVGLAFYLLDRRNKVILRGISDALIAWELEYYQDEVLVDIDFLEAASLEQIPSEKHNPKALFLKSEVEKFEMQNSPLSRKGERIPLLSTYGKPFFLGMLNRLTSYTTVISFFLHGSDILRHSFLHSCFHVARPDIRWPD